VKLPEKVDSRLCTDVLEEGALLEMAGHDDPEIVSHGQCCLSYSVRLSCVIKPKEVRKVAKMVFVPSPMKKTPDNIRRGYSAVVSGRYGNAELTRWFCKFIS
jgi:tRNA(Ile2) C34 agmatinyltransferase TiaS